MEKLPQISEAEYEIMKIIWKNSPISTNDICASVPTVHHWSSKKVISYEQRGRMYYYSPLISQEKYLSQENCMFLSRFYNGEATPLLSALLSNAQLSDEDLKNMYHLIDSKLNGGDKT